MEGWKLVLGFGVVIGCAVLYTHACNEAVCASLVSKCMLLKSCECNMLDKNNCTCCKDCHRCLAKLYTECCSCVGEWCTVTKNVFVDILLYILHTAYDICISELLFQACVRTEAPSTIRWKQVQWKNLIIPFMDFSVYLLKNLIPLCHSQHILILLISIYCISNQEEVKILD